MRSDSFKLPEGTVLGKRYRIVSVIGAGGFGITYKAIDLLNNIFCALKEFAPMEIAIRGNDGINMMPASKDKQDLYEHGKIRFLEEAEILKSLQNIKTVVSIMDYFNENGTSYFVMEYLDGVTLKALVRNMGGSIPWNQAAPILHKCASTMEHLHKDINIFHRDISPENIIITHNGEIKIIDFGNAKFIMSNGRQKLSVVLKPGFAPYEQYSSNGKQGSYTDVYSLAGTFYYVLSGQMIPQAPERIAGSTYIKLRNMNLGIPDYVSDAFDKALELQYQNRTQTMLEFLKDLRLYAVDKVLEKIAAVDSGEKNAGQPYLDVIVQGRNVTRYRLPVNSPIVIGRSQTMANIVLSGDTCISKNQCEIFYDTIEKRFYIQDHSTNGTYVNGIRLKKEKIYILEENQECAVGNQKISLKVGILYE